MPNESVKPVSILTEEELQEKINRVNNAREKGQTSLSVFNMFNELMTSHRALYAANAEFSFKNMNAKAKVKEYYLGLKENVGKSGLTEKDVYHATQAIENVLHAFNIKIEGVNA